MDKKNSPYELLLQKSKEIFTFSSILHLLHWDLETYMPPGAISVRSEQIALLSSHIHSLKTSRTYKNLLEKIVHLKSGKVKLKKLDQTQKLIIREWRRDFLREQKLPTAFIKAFSQATSEASQIWATAKKENNFKLFAPFLEKIVRMNQEKAERLGFSNHPYDALIENFEPCMTVKKIDTIFSGLRQELKTILKKIQTGKPTDDRFLHKAVPSDKQMEIAHWISGLLPIEKAYTRLDISSHPFSIALHPHDSRITTRILPNLFMSNIFSVLHEEGHSMYEMGLPIEQIGTPLAQATSLTVHESQSRWWETLIGRSFSFWKFFYPQLQHILPNLLKKVPLNQFYRAINQVSPSFIRVEADEVTYCLHVILRFEIEKMLIEKTIAVTDLPEVWNAKFFELFGIRPPSDAQGCLQDIHWSLGDFGYFPTYALGNLLSAQLFETFAHAHPDWEAQLSSGKLYFIREWLKTNVHQWGRTYNLDQLTKKVTGKPLSEKPYCRYLKKKYKEIY